MGGLLERRVQYIPCFQQNVALKELVWGQCHCAQVKGLGLGKVPLCTGYRSWSGEGATVYRLSGISVLGLGYIGVSMIILYWYDG